MQDLAQASDAFAEAGFAVPRLADDADPDVSCRSWQRSASGALDDYPLVEHRRKKKKKKRRARTPGLTVRFFCREVADCPARCS